MKRRQPMTWAFLHGLSSAAFLAASFLLMAAPAAAEGASTYKSALAPTYVTFDTFTVSVLENYKIRGILTLELALNVPDKTIRREAERQKPRLRDAFVRLLIDHAAQVLEIDRVPDLDGLAARLQDVCDQSLGQAGARVLITQAHLRRLN